MGTKSKTISRASYLQLLGLFILAERHYKKTEECRKEMEQLTGDEDFGHLADAIYGKQGDLDSALKKMRISVRK